MTVYGDTEDLRGLPPAQRRVAPGAVVPETAADATAGLATRPPPSAGSLRPVRRVYRRLLSEFDALSRDVLALQAKLAALQPKRAG